MKHENDNTIKKLEQIEQIYNEWKNDYRKGTGAAMCKIGEILGDKWEKEDDENGTYQ